MDRLTERDQGGNGVCGSQYRCEEPCHECAHHKNILNLLAAYEDTGLTPEEIKELKATIDAFNWQWRGLEVTP